MNKQVSIYLRNSSTNSIRLNGFSLEDNKIMVHSIDTSAAFDTALLADLRQPFQVGLTYTYAEIADFFLVQIKHVVDFTPNAIIEEEGANDVNLSTKLGAATIVVSGNGVSITDGDATPSVTDHTDFGTQAASSGSVTRTFSISNSGLGSLLLSGSPAVVLAGTNADQFSVVQPINKVVKPGAVVTFTVTFDPSSAGAKSATLSIANNDTASNKNPFNFSISGTGS